MSVCLIHPCHSSLARYRTGWLAGAACAALLTAGTAQAALPLVSACTGASLPASRLTPVLTPLVNGIFGPLTTIPIIGPTLLGGVGAIVSSAVSGQTIGLDVLTVGGGILTPGAACAQQADGFALTTPKGITIGGNSIDGLGASGLAANAGELGSIALGNTASTAAAATNSIALGTNAKVTGTSPNAIAIGNGATATTAGGVALGGGSIDKAATPTAGATIGGTAYTFAGTTPASVVSVGAAGAERQIANVAAGQLSAASTDAVNGSQLFATNTQVGVNTTAITNLTNGTAGLVQQATPTSPITVGAATGGNVVNVAGIGGPRTVTGVALGSVGAGSVDAVNGGQVNGLGTSVATGLGGGSTFDPVTGTVTAPAYAVATITATGGVGAPTTATTVGGAVTSLSTDVTNLATSITAGTAGTVQRTPVGNQLALTATGGSGAAPGAPQNLTNVAAGTLAPTSTDAVNGSQLAATNTNVTTNTTAITNLNNGAAGPVQQTGAPNSLALVAPGGTGAVPGTPQTLSNVAAGVATTDAANVGQVTAAVGTATANAVQYDTAGGVRTNSVTLAGGAAGPVTVTNVAPGALTAASTDAVNGSQLFATNTGVGGIAGVVGGTYNPVTGAYTGPTYATVGGTSATTVQGAFNNYNTAITGLTNGTAGLVQQATPTAPITVGAATGGTDVNVSGTAGSRTITGVAAGSTAAGSTQAINGAQLNTGLASVATNLGGGSTYNPATGTVTAPSYTVQGTTYTNVGAALAGLDAGVTGNTTAINNLSTTINAGTVGTVQRTGVTNALALTAVGGTGAVPGAAQKLGNVAAGTATTDAVNVGQLNAVGSVAANSVQYDTTGGVRGNSVTLAGGAAGPVKVTNVAPAALSATSTDAVNGAQLFATNTQTATNTTNIAGNTTAINNLNNGTAGIVQQTGGSPGTGPITVGAATGGTVVNIAGTGGVRTLTGLKDGVNGTDAVTVAQINNLTGGQLNVVQYDTSSNGGRSNTITLTGGAAGPVTITNLAAGSLAPGSTDAVTGGQLATTNATVAGNTTTINQIVTGQAGAFRSNNAAAAPAPVATGANATAGGFGSSATGAGSLALGNGAVSTGTGSVAIGQGSTDGGAARVVSVGGVGSERRITNVANGVSGTDAVNFSQLQAATTAFGTTATGLQNQINQTNFDLNQVRRRANGGTAGAMAVAGLPQAFEPGKTMVGGAFGFWADQVAFAVGASGIVGDNAVVKVGASISGQGIGGFNVGAGWQF